MSCPHCEFINRIFRGDMNGYEYWLMTEVFVYLHGGDECKYKEIIETLNKETE